MSRFQLSFCPSQVNLLLHRKVQDLFLFWTWHKPSKLYSQCETHKGYTVIVLSIFIRVSGSSTAKMFFPPTPRVRHLRHLNFKTYTISPVALAFTREKKLEFHKVILLHSSTTTV